MPLAAQVVDAELAQHVCGSLAARWARQMKEAIFGILLDRKMGEECEILNDVAYTAAGHGNVDAGAGIEQDALADGDPPGIRSSQSGNAVEQRGFSGPRGAEQYGESRGGIELDIKRECALRCGKAFANAGGENWICRLCVCGLRHQSRLFDWAHRP